MPVYCYTREDGKRAKVEERLYAMGEAPKTIQVDGVAYERNIQAEHAGSARPGDLWPLYSEAAGVMPHQVQGATEEWRKAGIPTDFTSDGRAIFRDASHRKKFLRRAGLFDKQGYY